MNGGTCFTDSQLMIGCNCPCSFTGLRCDVALNPCSNSECQNGTCISNGCDYTCQCQCGYTGPYCDIQLNVCFENLNQTKCYNGGTCVNQGCTYTCNCPPGYTGPMCQILINLCDSMTCLNGGTCVPLVNDYQCECPCSYYSGKNCEVKINYIYELRKMYIR